MQSFDAGSLLLIPKLYRENVEPYSLMRALYPSIAESTARTMLMAMVELRLYYNEESGLKRWRGAALPFPVERARMLCQFKSFYSPRNYRTPPGTFLQSYKYRQ